MNKSNVGAWIGVGANLDEPKIQVSSAIEHLNKLEHVNVDESSSLYQTEPIGNKDQPDFINAVVRVSTKLDPLDMLHQMFKIESEFGRVRDGSQNSPRRLDLDLLIYGELVINSTELILPHPRMKDRLFVLEPLRELEGNFDIPVFGCVSGLISKCSGQRVEKLDCKY